eukprot:5737760-Prymnesium_polylepis.1
MEATPRVLNFLRKRVGSIHPVRWWVRPPARPSRPSASVRRRSPPGRIRPHPSGSVHPSRWPVRTLFALTHTHTC